MLGEGAAAAATGWPGRDGGGAVAAACGVVELWDDGSVGTAEVEGREGCIGDGLGAGCG